MLQQIATGMQSPEIPMNENFKALEHQACYAYRASGSSGLVWAYYGGMWGGFSITDDVLALTDNTDNYIVVEIATGDITIDTATTDWDDDTDFVRVYMVTTAAGLVTAVGDYRGGPGGVHGGGGGGGGGGGTANVSAGGTGVTSLTAYAPMFGGTTSTNPVQSGTVGTSGQVLTSNGASALPTFQTPAGGGTTRVDFVTSGSFNNQVATGLNATKQLTLSFALAANTGTSAFRIQIGDATNYGYNGGYLGRSVAIDSLGVVTVAAFANDIAFPSAVSAATIRGSITFTLVRESYHYYWSFEGTLSRDGVGLIMVAGTVDLQGPITRVQLLASSAAWSFIQGSVLYE